MLLSRRDYLASVRFNARLHDNGREFTRCVKVMQAHIYFHLHASNHRRRNYVSQIKVDSGWVQTQVGMEDAFHHFFCLVTWSARVPFTHSRPELP